MENWENKIIKKLERLDRETDRRLELEKYKEDERNFNTYQKSGHCLWEGTWAEYCRAHKLYRNILK